MRVVVGASRKRPAFQRPRLYGRPVAESLKKIWYLICYMCGKRLAVALRTTLYTLIEMGELEVSFEVRQKLSRISPANIDRLLAREKKKLKLEWRRCTQRLGGIITTRSGFASIFGWSRSTTRPSGSSDRSISTMSGGLQLPLASRRTARITLEANRDFDRIEMRS